MSNTATTPTTGPLTVLSMSGMNAAEQAVYDCEMPDGDGLSVLIHASDYIDDSQPLPDQLGEVRSICRTIALRAIAAYLRSSK
jgi:hypothetical protein